MADNRNLAAALIEDYVDQGFGTKLTDFSMKSHDGTAELELDSIVGSGGEVEGIEIFENELSIAELMYDDEEFNTKLLSYVASVLNI